MPSHTSDLSKIQDLSKVQAIGTVAALVLTLEAAQRQLEHAIGCTPTGSIRDELTIVNIDLRNLRSRAWNLHGAMVKERQS